MVVEVTPTERAAVVTRRLMEGETLTSRRVADDLEITPDGARKLLGRLSRVLPLVELDGQWQLIQFVRVRSAGYGAGMMEEDA